MGNSRVDCARRINNVKDIIAGYYTATTPPPPTPGQCSGSAEVPLTVEVNTDRYPGETSWTLTNTCTNGVVDSADQGSLSSSKTKYTNNYCVPPASYRFTINDSFGDGMCCGYGSSLYSVSYDSNVEKSGAQFTRSESSSFGSCSGGGGDSSLCIVGDNGSPLSAFPLGVCKGDCDSDFQCSEGLKCFLRRGTDPIPGCSGSGVSGKDYCYEAGGGGTTFCGCSTCTQQVWDTFAGDYTCGARISWLQTARGQSESEACSNVDTEFPSTCFCG